MEMEMDVQRVGYVRPDPKAPKHEIEVWLEGEINVEGIRLFMSIDTALGLASKIESTYQGIVGPVDPEPDPLATEPTLRRREPDPTRRCAFTAHDTGDRCTRQGTLVHAGVAYFCEEHHNRGGSCPTSGG